MLLPKRFMPLIIAKISLFMATANRVGSAFKIFSLAAILAHFAAPALAESHASGEKAFSKQCVSCHVVVNEAGDTLAGRKAKAGPNLYGITMRALGTFPGFRYGDSIVKAGKVGTVWNKENFVGFVQNPTGWLRVMLKDPKARSKMSFKVRKEEDALNIFAFLQAIGPEVAVLQTEEVEAEPKVKVVAVKSLVSYASDQADRGKKKYEKKCAECHGKEFKGGMNGGPPLRGLNFLEKWGNGEPASSLYYFLSEQMPPESPGRFSSKVYADIMAYILKKNGFKRGAPLPSNVDALEQLIIKQK
jgi:cytochrome c